MINWEKRNTLLMTAIGALLLGVILTLLAQSI
jgi:hypothetical protein